MIAMAVLLTLTGCSGLSVNWDMSATYRSDVELGQRSK